MAFGHLIGVHPPLNPNLPQAAEDFIGISRGTLASAIESALFLADSRAR
jgi:hypothetical protein